MNKIFEHLISKRGLNDEFLHPQYEKLTDAFLLPDMEKAIERIKAAISCQEKVLIYGDYDVDGVTSSTLMEQALKMAGIKEVEIMLPDRFADGYGMSPKLVKRAEEQGIGLVITVDCGSANKEIVQDLQGKNIDVIITDHHECTRELPDAVAVVNPKRQDCDLVDVHDLAGVGVAFKLAQGLVKVGLIPDGQEKWLLDLVLIGTICDNMPLVRENRILCYFGLKVLAKSRRAGLAELFKCAGVSKFNSETIGFQIGPRLNAAGRIESADLALNLLRAKSSADAAALASKLEQLNSQRKSEQNEAMAEIEKRGVSAEPVIIEAGDWHEGILGIVAGRLVDKYRRPAFVLSKVGEGIMKGSGRSFGDFSLAEALAACGDTIINGGGHAGAAGVKIETGKVSDFCEQINAYYKSLKLQEQEKYFYQAEDLSVEELGDINLELIDDLAQLEPFGEGNAEPILLLSDVEIMEVRVMGQDGKHLCLMVQGKDRKILKLVGFSVPQQWFLNAPGDHVNILIQICENEWNHIRSVEGRIINIYA